MNFALPVDWVQALPTFLTMPTKSKEPSKQDAEEAEAVFLSASTVSSNVITFVDQRRILNSDFHTAKGTRGVMDAIVSSVTGCLNDQASPECDHNWPIWQQASLYMLQLRTQIIGSGPGKDELESTFLQAARDTWGKVKNVYCKNRPSGKYTDLEGEISTCPASK